MSKEEILYCKCVVHCIGQDKLKEGYNCKNKSIIMKLKPLHLILLAIIAVCILTLLWIVLTYFNLWFNNSLKF